MNRKKINRVENKKRKIMAFLQLVGKDKPQRRPTPNNTKTTSKVDAKIQPAVKKQRIENVPLQSLQQKMKEAISDKQQSQEQSFDVKTHSRSCAINNPFANPDATYESGETTHALCMNDVRDLVLYALLDADSQTKPVWCNAGKLRGIKYINMIVVDNISCQDVYRYKDMFQTSAGYLKLSEMMRLNVTASFTKELIFDRTLQDTHNRPATKIDLLLSPVQMFVENYPTPDFVTGQNGFIFSKEEYKEVSEESPMFGVDCEMCMTLKDKMALTRVSIVDEQHKVLYDTLVKPPSKIINYMTEFSGITKELMDGVTTTLEDVQNEIKDNLPADAILVGQSLNNDLIALKMVHPYNIDTSLIYNLIGYRKNKTSLKKLSAKFLDESIQCGTGGHDSIEDSSSALKLVQLKLSKDLRFGDVILGYETDIGKGIFQKVIGFQKKCSLIGQSEILETYAKENVGGVNQICREDMDELVKLTISQANGQHLTISHFAPSEMTEENLSKIDSCIAKVYEKRKFHTLTVVVFTGIGPGDKNSMGLLIPMV